MFRERSLGKAKNGIDADRRTIDGISHIVTNHFLGNATHQFVSICQRSQCLLNSLLRDCLHVKMLGGIAPTRTSIQI